MRICICKHHILINGHLHDIDSGKLIETEGLKISKTMKGFISNIEDNTLDIIGFYKTNIELNKEIKDLKNEIHQLKIIINNFLK